jgi:hypothetical protein
MSRLGRPWARRGCIRQRVAFEHDDLFEMGSSGFCCGEACHPSANDYCLLQVRTWLKFVSR